MPPGDNPISINKYYYYYVGYNKNRKQVPCPNISLDHTRHLSWLKGPDDGLIQTETCSQSLEREYKLCLDYWFIRLSYTVKNLFLNTIP